MSARNQTSIETWTPVYAPIPTCYLCTWVWHTSQFRLKYVNSACREHAGVDASGPAPPEPDGPQPAPGVEHVSLEAYLTMKRYNKFLEAR